jgi:hypothetical protein
MAGMGPPPKPPEQRRRRNAEAIPQIVLPAEREGDPPALPAWREWHFLTLEWWASIWHTPQATQWDQKGLSLQILACLYDDLIAGRSPTARLASEIRHWEDAHGLSPKGMLQLRWHLAGEPDDGTPMPKKTSSSARRARLRVVGPHRSNATFSKGDSDADDAS